MEDPDLLNFFSFPQDFDDNIAAHKREFYK
jgi:hypothetical protein